MKCFGRGFDFIVRNFCNLGTKNWRTTKWFLGEPEKKKIYGDKFEFIALVDPGIYTCCFSEAEHFISCPNGFFAGINDQPMTHQWSPSHSDPFPIFAQELFLLNHHLLICGSGHREKEIEIIPEIYAFFPPIKMCFRHSSLLANVINGISSVRQQAICHGEWEPWRCCDNRKWRHPFISYQVMTWLYQNY